MDGAHIAAASQEAGGASSSASSASSYDGSASGHSWMRKGMHLRRRQQVAVRGGGRAGGGDVQDLALPLGMSFVAVLAQVLNRCSGSEGRLRPDVLSKMCTSAVKESLTNIYGDRFQSFMSNFEKAFGSTLRTIHLINETPVYEQDMAQCSYKDGNSVPEIKLGGADSLPEIKLGGADSPSQIRDVQTDMPSSSMNNQIVLHAGINHQLVHLTRSRSNPEIDQHILSVFERSLNEQARSNELKELEIGLAMRKLQLSRSQLALSSDSHMLEKIKVRMGFQKASFKEKKFKTEMEDTKHAELFRKLIDMLLTAVVLMSVCFGYGTYIYSYQQITAATSACAANFKGVYILVDAKFSVSIELWFAAFQMPCDSSNKDILWNFDAPINWLVDFPAFCNGWTKHASNIQCYDIGSSLWLFWKPLCRHTRRGWKCMAYILGGPLLHPFTWKHLAISFTSHALWSYFCGSQDQGCSFTILGPPIHILCFGVTYSAMLGWFAAICISVRLERACSSMFEVQIQWK